MMLGIASAEDAIACDRRAAQKLFRPHRLPAGALQLDETHRALAASDGQLVVEHLAGLAAAGAFGRAQNLDAADADKLEPGAGEGRQSAAMVVDVLPG